jgi:flagellar biosynthetic protein FliR
MPAELTVRLDVVVAFALVLARTAGTLSFVPLPGLRNLPPMARAALAATLAAALLPLWPLPPAGFPPAGALALMLVSEAAFGAGVGVAVAVLNEAFVLAAQIFGLQAGYGYASTVDPTTEADSSVLQILAHLTGGLLFFAFGLEGEVLRAFARSLEAFPPGGFAGSLQSVEAVLGLGAVMFSTATRLALPLVGLLVLIDLSLALLGRINAQLQLLTLAFPAKMLVSMAVLAALAPVLPRLYRDMAGAAFQAVAALASPAP